MITDSLTEKADHFVQIMDDATAQSILVELGIINKFSAVPRPPGFTGGYANAAGYSDHVTHWIFGLLYSGYEKAEDNGYAVMCFPKSKFTGDQALNKIRSELAKGGGIEGEKWVNSSPLGN